MNRSAIRLVVVIPVVLILVAGIGGIAVWMKITDLKKVLVSDIEDALGAKVEVTSLDLDLWHGELRAAGISLTNERPEAPWEKGEISQATARFHLGDLFASTLPLSVEVSSWNVVLHPYVSRDSSSNASPVSGPGSSLTSAPSKRTIRVTRLSAHEGEVEIHLSDNKTVSLHGVAFESSDNGAGVWTTELQTTSLVAGSLETGSSSVQIRGDPEKITFSNLRMHCGQDDGMMSGDGEIALSGRHAAHVALTATDVPAIMLLGIQWQMKLSGLVSGDLTYEGTDQTSNAHGQLVVSKGKFNVLPWLGKITALVNLPDITGMEVDKATSSFEWKNHTLYLTNLDVRKNDVSRISGDVTVDPTGQVDGKLKLGLPSTVTARWPQLQEKVFSVQMEDYNWTDVHLTGTPDHLQEDLTSRVLAVGLDQGSGVINQASQKAMDLLKNFLNN
jgi:hypothetical protein